MFLNQNALYYERMASSIGDKARMIPFLKGQNILEIGFGGGELLDILETNHFNAHGIDASEVSVSKVADRPYAENIVEAYADEILTHWKPETFDAVLLSSILHEVYSYGNRNGHGRHSLGAVEETFDAINASLKTGGRIIIRDGVKSSNWSQPVILTMLNGDSQGVKNYLELQPFSDLSMEQVGPDIWAGNLQSVQEFAYTYTWGEQALPRESQELFGIMTLKEYADLLEKHGFHVIHAEEYVQQGYVDALSPKLSITTPEGEAVPFPSTNAVWVAEKK